MKRLLLILAALLYSIPAFAQAPTKLCFPSNTAGTNCITVDASNPLPVSASATITFPTIGAAVPATGIYNGLNVAGTLRGMTGLALGSTFSQTMAIVDGSGNQITSFGATGTTSNASSAVATSATNVPTVGYLYGFNGTTWDQLQVDASKNLKVLPTGISVAGVAVAGTTASGILCSSTTAAAGSSNGNWFPLNCTTTGQVRMDQSTIVGTAVDVNSGNKSAGTQRNVLATDQLALATWGQVATAAAPPSGSTAVSVKGSGATAGLMAHLISCDSHVFKHITSATDTLAVQGVTSQSIYICSWRSRAAGTATWFLENTASVNANCSSSNTQITGLASEVANSGETWGSNFWSGLKNTASNGLCINSTGTGGVDIDIWYTQF